jgi:hypothetical protein
MAFCCCGAGATSSVTSKSANQLRHLETLGISRGSSPRLRRTEVQIPVTLNVYSLLESNKKLSKMGMGVYHTGVVVYGIEWGYGEVVENPNASGLFCVHPGQAAGTLYRTIRIGYTTRSPMQVDTILHRLENEWRSCEYHILHHNCNHFAQAFCDLLSTTEKLQVPAWCNRAARVGDRIIPRKLATKIQHMMDDEPPKAVPPTPFTNVNEVPMSVVPREWYLHPSIFQPMRYVGDSRAESLRSHDNVPAANGDESPASPAATASHNGGGGGSRYTVEYDILPPPGYEPEEVRSSFPPLMRREIFLATDENGSISRMTAIEEQPSVSRASRVESTRKATRSQRAIKSTPGSSPAPPPLGAGTASDEQDRIVALSRVCASASHPLSVAPTGSPQASVLLDSETESVLRSDDSEDVPPRNVPRPDTSALQLLSSTAAAAAEGGGGTTSLPMRSVRHRSPNSRPLSVEETFSSKPFYTMYEASLPSASLNASVISCNDGGHTALDHPPLPHQPHAQPVGCINALPPTSSAPVINAAQETEEDEKSTRERRHTGAAHDRQTTTATDTRSEASVNPKTAVDFSKHRRGKDSKALCRKKPDSSHPNSSSSTKRLHDFSDIVAVPDASLTSPSAGPVPATEAKKKNSSWVFLFKARATDAGGEGSKKGKKYLTSPSLSDTTSRTDNNNFDRVSETSSLPASQGNSAVQPMRSPVSQHHRWNTVTTTTAAPALKAARGGGRSAVDAAPTTPMAVESVSDTGLDGKPVRETTTAYVPASPPSPVLLHPLAEMACGKESAFLVPFIVHDGEEASTNMSGGTPVAVTEGKRSPGLLTPNTPQNRRVSPSNSTSEMHLQPLPRRLSESVVLPIGTGVSELRSPSATSLPDVLPPLPDVPELQDGVARRIHSMAVTPERAIVSATSGAATTGTSPATAHRQTRRGSSSVLSDSTTPPPPPLQAERARTPIPNSRKQHAGHGEHASSSPLLDVGGDAEEPPVPRHGNSSRRGSHAGGEVGTPRSPDKAAHTPMAPFPRRPSLLSRERPPTTSAKASQETPDPNRSASVAQRSLAVELKETPPKPMAQGGSRSTLDDA